MVRKGKERKGNGILLLDLKEPYLLVTMSFQRSLLQGRLRLIGCNLIVPASLSPETERNIKVEQLLLKSQTRFLLYSGNEILLFYNFF